ncbi:hypothetical protein GQX74_002204 [Glossina fuscipes]|nr:hypothetical protein GQX74_002204 [Glossina fuscipes]
MDIWHTQALMRWSPTQLSLRVSTLVREIISRFVFDETAWIMANTLAAKRGVAPSQLSDELTMPASMSLQMSAEPVANKSQCVLTPAESGGMSIHMALLYGLGTILAIVWVGTFSEFTPTTTHTPSCKGSTCANQQSKIAVMCIMIIEDVTVLSFSYDNFRMEFQN